MIKFILAAIFAAFFVSNALAQMQGKVVPLPVFCALEKGVLQAEALSEGKQIVWSKKHFGGGHIVIYMNMKTKEWTMLEERQGYACKVASNAKREIGS